MMPVAHILSLLIISATLILGAVILLHNPHKRPNQVLAGIVLSSSFWVFTNLMVDMAKSNSAVLRWSQMTLLGPILIPFLFLYFSYVFPRPSKINKLKRVFIFLPALLLLFIPTRYNIQEAYLVPDGIPQVIPGILYVPFFIYFSTYVAIALYNFLKNIKKASSLEKLQIKYVIIGTILTVSIGLITNVLLLSLGISEASSFGPHGTIFWTIFLSLAILKHHLFDIKVIATELFTALLILLLFINIFSYNTFGQLILNIVIFMGAIIFGIFLIKSVLQEVKTREEKEKLALDLEQANVKLQKLDKAKSEFISIASHQLRTPLAAIIGYLSMVLEGSYGKISKRAARPISNVFKAGKQLNRLVNTLLNVSRIEAGKITFEPKKLSLKEVIEPIVKEFQIVAKERGLYLKLEMPPSLPPISLDVEKINQVIMNLIDNAIKYTEKGGITVKVNRKKSKGKNKVLIAISDTGLGMDKEQINQIFEKFQRGATGEKAWTGGAGLGLFIAKKFVELHQGKIWAESEGEGKGSTFFIELPIK